LRYLRLNLHNKKNANTACNDKNTVLFNTSQELSRCNLEAGRSLATVTTEKPRFGVIVAIFAIGVSQFFVSAQQPMGLLHFV